VVWPIRRLFLVLEGNGETDGERTKYYVTPELVWKPGEHVELTLGVPVGVTRAAGDYGIIARVTIEFENVPRGTNRSPEHLINGGRRVER
jgi:hypothetical protein